MGALRKGNIWSLVVVDQNFSRELAQSYWKKSFVNGFDHVIHVYSDNTSKHQRITSDRIFMSLNQWTTDHQVSYAIRDALLRAVRNMVERFLSNLDDDQSANIGFNRTDSDWEYDDDQDEISNHIKISFLIDCK